MSYTIFSAPSAFPCLQSGITETTFKSGLKRTSGVVLCTANTISDAETLMSNYGNVFPSPEIIKTESGILEIPFSAYRQATVLDEINGISTPVNGSLVLGVNLLNLSKSFSQEVSINSVSSKTFNWSVSEIWLVDTVTIFSTLNSESKNYPVLPNSYVLSASLNSRKTFGIPAPGAPGYLVINWSNEITSISRSNYGEIDEVEITYSRTPNVL